MMYYQQISPGQLYMMAYSQALAQQPQYPSKEDLQRKGYLWFEAKMREIAEDQRQLARSIIDRKQHAWDQEAKFVRPTLPTHKCDLCSDEFPHDNPRRVNMKGDFDPDGYLMCPYCEDTCRERTDELSLCHTRG
jgi:hypothetical protein